MIPHGTISGYVYHRCRCVPCKTARRNYVSSRRDPVKEVARVRRWRSTERGRIKRAEWRRTHRHQENAWRDAWIARNPERYKAIARARNAQRYARQRGASGTATADQILARMAYHGFRCVYCGAPFEEVDHAISLASGGSNWPANLIPACSPCNKSKGKKRWGYGKTIIGSLPPAREVAVITEVQDFFGAVPA